MRKTSPDSLPRRAAGTDAVRWDSALYAWVVLIPHLTHPRLRADKSVAAFALLQQ